MPEPLMKGRFTLYETPDGGYHIAYIVDDEDQAARHIEIPAMVVKMARATAAGKMNPVTAMRALMNQ